MSSNMVFPLVVALLFFAAGVLASDGLVYIVGWSAAIGAMAGSVLAAIIDHAFYHKWVCSDREGVFHTTVIVITMATILSFVALPLVWHYLGGPAVAGACIVPGLLIFASVVWCTKPDNKLSPAPSRPPS